MSEVETRNPVCFPEHPLIQHVLGLLRRGDTGAEEFRQLAGELTLLLFYELTKNHPTKLVRVHTPIYGTTVNVLAGKSPILVPVLKPTLSVMCDNLRAVVPEATVSFIGVYTNEQSKTAVVHRATFPEDCAERPIFLLDPVLATGNAACDAIRELRERGCDTRNITYLCLVATPEGTGHLQREHPGIQVVAAGFDEWLDEYGHANPGLCQVANQIFDGQK